ncbi:ssDNA binding protein [Mycobacterium phage ScoobyDoobyDoo]|nr:ssDNA binding protein [Mycobacterium phage ScoobyDoobyDoo]
MAKTGLKAINDAIAESSKGGGGFSGRLGYFNLKPDESIALRFLTDVDDILTVDFYEFIQDNKGKSQNFVVRPDLLDDPNAEDYVLTYGGMQKDYGSTDLTEPTPKTRTVALAVVQREVVTENDKGRKVVTYEDEWVDIETKNGTFEGRQFIVVKQAYKNFWSPLVGFYDENGTLCDRIYKIKRNGKGTDTSYSFMEKQIDPEWNHDGSSYKELHERYGYGTDKSSVPEDERFAYCPQTLTEWAEYMASEDRVKFFLGDASDRDEETSGADKPPLVSDEADEAQAAPAPAPKASGSLQERLAKHR